MIVVLRNKNQNDWKQTKKSQLYQTQQNRKHVGQLEPLTFVFLFCNLKRIKKHEFNQLS